MCTNENCLPRRRVRTAFPVLKNHCPEAHVLVRVRCGSKPGYHKASTSQSLPANTQACNASNTKLCAAWFISKFTGFSRCRYQGTRALVPLKFKQTRALAPGREGQRSPGERATTALSIKSRSNLNLLFGSPPSRPPSQRSSFDRIPYD